MEANSEEEAKDKAIKEACDSIFSDKHADYEVEDCVEAE